MDRAVVLNVRGHATVEVPPDYAWIGIGASVVDSDQAGALLAAEAVAAEVRRVIDPAEGVRRLLLSRVRVGEESRWDDAGRTHVHIGWRATVSGRAEVDVATVGAVAELVVAAGAQVQGVDWLLDDENPAHRQVRRDAVADAIRAAGDFAAALGRPLGPLRTLADPGLLRGDGEGRPGAAMMRMSADFVGSGPGELELDPEPQHLYAHVEATFEVV